MRREHLRFSTGRGFLRVEPVRRAAELSRPWPDSWQHGYALAEVAQASLWADEPDAQDAVSAAVEAAEAIGHPRVTAYAFAAAAMGAEYSNRPGGPALAARGVQGAAEARDWWGFVHASLWEANTSQHAHLARVGRERARATGTAGRAGGAPSVPRLALHQRGVRALPGRRLEGRDGAGFGSRSVPTRARRAMSRPGSWRAQLAVAQGRQHEAEDHLSRAEELSADTTAFRAWQFDAVRALVRTGAGDARGAYAAAMTGLLSPGVPPTMCEWLCPLAARALADLVAAARDMTRTPVRTWHAAGRPRRPLPARRSPTVRSRSRSTEDRSKRSTPCTPPRWPAPGAARTPPPCWRRAAELLDGLLPWDAAYAAYRAGEAVLVQPEGSREDAAALLRRRAPLGHRAQGRAGAARGHRPRRGGPRSARRRWKPVPDDTAGRDCPG